MNDETTGGKFTVEDLHEAIRRIESAPTRKPPFWVCRGWCRWGGRTTGWSLGCNVMAGRFSLLWFNTGRIGRCRRHWCLSVLSGRRQFSGLFMWDTAHVSSLGDLVPFLRPLHSVLWCRWTKWTTGGSVTQCCAA